LPDPAESFNQLIVTEQAIKLAGELDGVPAGIDGSSKKTTLASGKSFFELGAWAGQGHSWDAKSHQLFRCRTGCCQAGFRPARPAIEAAAPDQNQQRPFDPAGRGSQLV
jgi:hypothetical protein